MSLDSLKQRLAGTSSSLEFIELEGAINSAFHISRELTAVGKPSASGPSVVDVNELAAQLEGVFERVLGAAIRTTLHLDAVDALVEAEAVQLEWVFLNLALITGSALIPRVVARWQRSRALAFAYLWRAATLGSAAVATTFNPALFGFLLQEIGWGFTEPVLQAWMNEHATSEQRATILSVRSMAFTLGGSMSRRKVKDRRTAMLYLGSVLDYMHQRALLPGYELPDGSEWLDEPGPREKLLNDEQKARWLVWREEIIAAGVTSLPELRARLAARSAEWLTTPRAEDGKSPMQVVGEERG